MTSIGQRNWEVLLHVIMWVLECADLSFGTVPVVLRSVGAQLSCRVMSINLTEVLKSFASLINIGIIWFELNANPEFGTYGYAFFVTIQRIVGLKLPACTNRFV